MSIKVEDLSHVSETLLLPLYYRAVESERPDALIHDPKALELIHRLDYDFSHFKKLSNEQVTAIVRLRVFDRCTQGFLTQHPAGIVVNIGCGLDTQFYRVDNGAAEWYELDLPPVIELRRRLFDEPARSHLLACSAFDFAWMDSICANQERTCLFLAEGVLPYFGASETKRLVLALKKRFPGSELVFDALTPPLVWIHNLELALAKVPARLKWGLKHAQELERWEAGIRLLGEWFYFEQPEARLRGLGWMRFIPMLNKSASILHYRLGP